MRYQKFTLGQVEAVFNKLGGEEGVRRFLAGDREVVITRHVINPTLDPSYNFEFFCISEHRRGKIFHWNPDKIKLWQSKKQLDNKVIGSELKDELLGIHVLNATVRDYLLRHPTVIPESWKLYTICFWGTIFERRRKFVPTIRWDSTKGKWEDVYFPLDGTFDQYCVALTL